MIQQDKCFQNFKSTTDSFQNDGLQKKFADNIDLVRGEMIKEVTEINQQYNNEIKGLKEIIGKELEKEEMKKY